MKRTAFATWTLATLAAGATGGVVVELYLFAVGLAAWPGVYQWVASAIVGPAAYSAERYAWIGLAMHAGFSFWWAGLYAGLASALPVLRRRPAFAGTAYGLAVFVAMQLAQWAHGSWTAPDAPTLGHLLVDHALFFGVPVAFTVAFVAGHPANEPDSAAVRRAA